MRAARLFLGESGAADEALLGEVHGPAEVELERRGPLARDQRLAGGDVIDIDQHEARLDACQVERQHAGGHDAVGSPGRDECIPDGQGVGAVHPDLVAEIAGIAGARDLHRDVA